jgi:hypothetical protein
MDAGAGWRHARGIRCGDRLMQQARSPQNDDRSLGELFSELTRELTTLVRQEAALAKTELSQKAGDLVKNVGFLAAGGAVVYGGFLALIAAAIIVLAELGMAWWLAALIVAGGVLGAGYFLIQKGLTALKEVNLAPRQTVESLKEDREAIKEHVG